jgi:hypothetical protein
MVDTTHVDLVFPIIYVDLANPDGSFTNSTYRMWPNSDRLSSNLTSYRFDEVTEYTVTSGGFVFKLAYSMRSLVRIQAVLSLARMVFITGIMGLALVWFQGSTLKLVLNPIERMLEKVKLIARNPLAAAQEEQMLMAGLMTWNENKAQTSK